MTGPNDDVIENLMNCELGGDTHTPPATVYMAMLISGPTSSAGTGMVEAAGGTYARVAKTNNNTNFPDCTSGTRKKTNGTAITYASMSTAIGSVEGIGIFYAASGGDCKWYAPKPGGPEPVGIGNVVSIGVGQLEFTCVP